MPDYPTLEPTARTNTAALLRPCWLDGMAIMFMTALIAAGLEGFKNGRRGPELEEGRASGGQGRIPAPDCF